MADTPAPDSLPSLAPRASTRDRLGRPLPARFVPEAAAGSVLVGAGSSFAGAVAGWMVGAAIVSARCDPDAPPLSTPGERSRHCPLFGGSDGIAYGWAIGSYAGTALGAAVVAESRGCSSYDARTRAFLGAAVGSIPLVASFARHRRDLGEISESISVSAPFLQIAGATLAISRCRVVRELPPGESRGLRRLLGL